MPAGRARRRATRRRNNSFLRGEGPLRPPLQLLPAVRQARATAAATRTASNVRATLWVRTMFAPARTASTRSAPFRGLPGSTPPAGVHEVGEPAAPRDAEARVRVPRVGQAVVALGAGARERLKVHRVRSVRSARSLQCFVRCALARKKVAQLRSAVRLQRVWRGSLARRRHASKKVASFADTASLLDEESEDVLFEAFATEEEIPLKSDSTPSRSSNRSLRNDAILPSPLSLPLTRTPVAIDEDDVDGLIAEQKLQPAGNCFIGTFLNGKIRQ